MPGEKILIVDDCETVRDLVGDILEEAGFKPLLAPDGATGIEMAQSKIPDLVLVDFIMPKMNGLRFCQVMRGIENLKKIPIVLMSVKAESIGEKFMQVVEIADTISKPFTAETLLAVIGHKLRGQPREKPLVVSADASAPSPVVPAEEESQYALEAIRSKIAENLRNEIKSRGKGVPKNLEEVYREALSDEFLRNLAWDYRKVNPLAGIAAFAGSTSAVTLGEALQLASHSNRSGVLEVSDENRRAAVYLRDGKITFARLRGGSEEFLLGRYLLKEELLSRDALERVTRQKEVKALLGERLVKTGLITREDLDRVLEQQTTEVIYEVLRWEEARYSFHPGVQSPESEASSLRLSVEEILMEGYRRVDEWRLIEKELSDFDIVVTRTGMVSEMEERLSSEESLVLDFVDGQRSVREIIRETRMASFDVCRVVYQLLSLKILKKVVE